MRKATFLFGLIVWCFVSDVQPTGLMNLVKNAVGKTKCGLHKLGNAIVQHDHKHGDPCLSTDDHKVPDSNGSNSLDVVGSTSEVPEIDIRGGGQSTYATVPPGGGGSLGDVEMVENNNTDVQNITLGGRFLTNVPCKGELKRIHSKCVKVYQNSP
ncbi:uncharacterized protein LOC132705022 isoform X1 [Cylas formicarius]|uniref:uncharacterized protein LOC132705022 isoform X1 n=1 Tax=Cylas formicarius TaxID=197179 RepID=UPI0029586551|nr:uncharacterized protein LOC132705022 isoform X1 [Cylas formicarius]